ncbi:MAG: YhfC family intramembrane metalloprotease, partial [Spirochaetales bacterium]|nr:YhfC family intramembrane metalloprotease [Spirochaetales bacterium]
ILPSIILYLVIAVFFSSGDVEKALSVLKINEETASSALPSVIAAASFDYQLMAMNILERILAMVAHIGFSVIVFYGVCNAKKAFLPLAILLHMLMDTFPALYQRGVVPLWSVEVWGAFCVALIALIAIRLYSASEN